MRPDVKKKVTKKEPQYITVGAFAKKMKVSKYVVYGWIARGVMKKGRDYKEVAVTQKRKMIRWPQEK